VTRRSLGALLLVLAAFGPSGCLFDTREPQGGAGGGSVWVPPTSPEIVVSNLVAAFEAGNFGDYQRALAEEFLFIPDATDVRQMAIERPGLPVYEGWTLEVETQVAETIFGGADDLEVDLVFVSEQLLPEGRLEKYDYTLSVDRSSGPSVYQGQAWFEVRQVPGGEWRIFLWEDVITAQTVESWGLLKGRNRQI